MIAITGMNCFKMMCVVCMYVRTYTYTYMYIFMCVCVFCMYLCIQYF